MAKSPYTTTANTQGYWKLEDLNDSSGNSRTLTNLNTVTFASGRFNNCADFGTANTNKALYVFHDLGVTGGNITISLWVKMRTEIASGEQCFVVQEDAGTFVRNNIRYQYNAGTRRLVFGRVKTNVGDQNTTYNLTMGTSNWYNIVYTYDGANIRGYVNGALVTSPAAASGNGSINGRDITAIGSDDTGIALTSFASAYIDEVIIENVAWSDSKIWSYYNDNYGKFFQMF